MVGKSEEILTTWFGSAARSADHPGVLSRNNPFAEDYPHRNSLWWRAPPATDDKLRESFQDLVLPLKVDGIPEKLSAELEEWKSDPFSCLSLIILLDQLPRNMFRGTQDMFAFDRLALNVAKFAIEKQYEKSYSFAHKLFLYMPFEHSEDLQEVSFAVMKIKELAGTCPEKQRKFFERDSASALAHLDMITKFKRYPHRNEILGRETTDQETAYLKSKKIRFISSVNKAQDNSEEAKHSFKVKAPRISSKFYEAKEQTAPSKKMKILMLHSFRQNSSILKTRTQKLRQALDHIADIVYINAPIVYEPTDETLAATIQVFGQVPVNEAQRIWWNSSPDNSEYIGIEDSVRYLRGVWEQQGPFHGIIGFSQGGCMASILAATNAFSGLSHDSPRFFIMISGFPPRSSKFSEMFKPNSIDIPSLHIYGTSDILVDNVRSIQLFRAFKKAKITTHSGGHFVPNHWPNGEIVSFVSEFQSGPGRIPFLTENTTSAFLRKAVDSGVQENFSDQIELVLKDFKAHGILTPFGMESAAKTLFLQEAPFCDFWFCSKTIDLKDLGNALLSKGLRAQDSLVAAFCVLGSLYESRIETTCVDESFSLFLNNVCAVLASTDEAIIRDFLIQVTAFAGFHLVQSFASATMSLSENFQNQKEIILSLLSDVLSAQLLQDWALYKTSSNLSKISLCAVYSPRIDGRVDRTCRLAKSTARKLYRQCDLSFVDNEKIHYFQSSELDKRACYYFYRTVIASLSKFLKSDSDVKETRKQPRVTVGQYESESSNGEILLNENVIRPSPMPVMTCPLEEFNPLITHLTTCSEIPSENLEFDRGTITPLRQLDLCKQVLGTSGVKSILKALEDNQVVKHLLLGNNIIHNEGGFALCDFLENKNSQITTLYIAGNEFTHEAIERLCSVLAKDRIVDALWLKRNPIGFLGVQHISKLLKVTNTLRVLDLSSCGLLDEGVKALFEGLQSNSSLLHLYIDVDGISYKGCHVMSDYLKSPNAKLLSLYLSCNPIGNEGVEILASGLSQNSVLEVLSIGSIGLTAKGLKTLTESLKHNSSLKMLNMGFPAATRAVGAPGNRIGDDGCVHLANLLEANSTIRSLDILHNDISQRGLEIIRQALEKNPTLTSMEFTQFGRVHNELTKECVKSYLSRNKEYAYSMGVSFEELDSIHNPQHLKDMRSVYRTK